MIQEWYIKFRLSVVPEVMQLTLILIRIKEALGSESNANNINFPPSASDTPQGEFFFIWMLFLS